MSNDYEYDSETPKADAPKKGAGVFKFKGTAPKFYKPLEDGAYFFDIIPTKSGIAFAYKVHTSVGKNNAKVLCPTTFGLPCPICEAQKKKADEMEANGVSEPWKTKEIKAYYPQERTAFNVIDIKHEADGIQILDASDFKFDKPLRQAVTTHKQINMLQKFPFTSPTEGSTVVATVKKEKFVANGKASDFGDWKGFQFIPRKKQYDNSIVDKTIDLKSMVNLLTYEQIETLFYGGELAEEPVQQGYDEKPVAEVKANPDVTNVATAVVEQPKPVVEPVVEQKVTIGVPPSTPVATAPVCPAGGTFGVDNDKFKSCDSCEIFNTCYREKKRLAQANVDVL